MNDGEALLQAVLEQPAEDTPRLAYADWLDEHDEPERAEFIRAAIELHHTPEPEERSHTPACVACHQSGAKCRYHTLLERVEELLRGPRPADRENSISWFNGGDESDTWELTLSPGWGRGFAEEINCDLATWLLFGPAVIARHPINEIRLREFRVEIEPPRSDHGWQLYYYHPGVEDNYFASSLGLSTRAEMIDRLLQDTRDLQGEFE